MVYHGDGFANTYKLYKETGTGFLSAFPFGAFAFTRLDERLKDEPLWRDAKKQSGRDPMGLTQSQPNVEYFTTECYGGPKQYDQFPIDSKHAFSMITELFSPRSKGTVTLASTDPLENPIVDCNYLSDPLDVLVLTEGVRYGNEIVMQGAGTKDIVKGSWPAGKIICLLYSRLFPSSNESIPGPILYNVHFLNPHAQTITNPITRLPHRPNPPRPYHP